MTIFHVSGSMLLVMLVGFLLRRCGYLSVAATAGLSRLLVDITFPALVLIQLPLTVDVAALRERWNVPLLGLVVILVGELVGVLLGPLFASRAERRTFIFVTAIANWIFLPLPIAQALYAAEGVQTVLLANVGAQVALWTIGVWTLAGGSLKNGSVLGDLLGNPGLIGTALGLVLALAVPGLAPLLSGAAPEAPLLLLVSMPLKALDLLGSLTVPLSLLVTGAQLGGLDLRRAGLDRAVGGVLLGRLLATPIACWGLMHGALALGFHLAPVPRRVLAVIASMPAAVSCGPMAERFGGDVALTTRAVFFTTVLGLATVPLLAATLFRY